MRTEDILECPRCGAVARPNVLMFGDFSWLSNRSANQEKYFRRFLKSHRQDKIVVIEMGAGTAISTIRNLGEGIGKSYHATIIRINPRDYRISPPHISLPCRSLEGLQGIDNSL